MVHQFCGGPYSKGKAEMNHSSPAYMGLNEDEAFEYCQKLISQTRRYNGEFVVLWHNGKFADRTGNYHLRLYRRLLDELCHT